MHLTPCPATQSISHIIKLFHTNSMPWCWKDINGIYNGLFLLKDTFLPKGCTYQDAVKIQSYFSQYNAQLTEDAKIRFTSRNKGDPIPGRKKWWDWVNMKWKKWRIHGRIMDVLTTRNLHPSMVMAVLFCPPYSPYGFHSTPLQ